MRKITQKSEKQIFFFIPAHYIWLILIDDTIFYKLRMHIKLLGNFNMFVIFLVFNSLLLRAFLRRMAVYVYV